MKSLPIGRVIKVVVAVVAAAGALIPRRRRKKRKDRDEEPTVDRTVDHTPDGV